MKLTLALIIAGLVVIAFGVVHDRSVKQASKTARWAAEDAAFAQRQAREKADLASFLSKSKEGIQQIEDSGTRLRAALDQIKTDAMNAQRPEMQRSMLLDSVEKRLAEAVHLEQLAKDELEATQQQAAEDAAHEKAVREFKSKLGQ